MRLQKVGWRRERIGHQVFLGRNASVNLPIDFGISKEELEYEQLKTQGHKKNEDDDAKGLFDIHHGLIAPDVIVGEWIK
jgi:hypothetical protein